MRAIRFVTLLLLLGCTGTAWGQTPEHTWSRCTTLDAAGGIVMSPAVGGTFGAAIGWELDHRFEIQGAGTWISRTEATEFAADLKLFVNLLRPAIVVPYAAAGIGLYQGVLERTASETNPTAVLGGGAHIYLRRHVSFRPEAVVRLVFDGSDVRPVTSVSFALSYHFEEHTSASRAR